MEENYLITIKGTMEQRGDTDTVELMTRGSLVHKDGAYYIVYKKNWISGWIAKGWNRGKSGPVKNIDLWKRLLKAKEQHQVTFIWVKGHAGHPQNERCDQLATTAADGNNLIEDEGLSL